LGGGLLTHDSAAGYVFIQSTEISGMDEFEEVVNLESLATQKDPFKEKLVELAKEHGESL
jgi:hypothetical protein